MSTQEVKMILVQLEDNKKLLQIGRSTFYDAFGPPVNSEENINSYLNEKFTLENITAELQNPKSTFYFAILNTETVGYVKLNWDDAQTEPMDARAMEIERIYVVKEYQGNRIGQILFEKALQVAKEKSMEFLWLGVWDENLGAIKFYKRNGFKIFDRHSFTLGTEIQTDIMMKLKL